jgi:hypothetical protein
MTRPGIGSGISSSGGRSLVHDARGPDAKGLVELIMLSIRMVENTSRVLSAKTSSRSRLHSSEAERQTCKWEDLGSLPLEGFENIVSFDLICGIEALSRR